MVLARPWRSCIRFHADAMRSTGVYGRKNVAICLAALLLLRGTDHRKFAYVPLGFVPYRCISFLSIDRPVVREH